MTEVPDMLFKCIWFWYSGKVGEDRGETEIGNGIRHSVDFCIGLKFEMLKTLLYNDQQIKFSLWHSTFDFHQLFHPPCSCVVLYETGESSLGPSFLNNKPNLHTFQCLWRIRSAADSSGITYQEDKKTADLLRAAVSALNFKGRKCNCFTPKFPRPQGESEYRWGPLIDWCITAPSIHTVPTICNVSSL